MGTSITASHSGRVEICDFIVSPYLLSNNAGKAVERLELELHHVLVSPQDAFYSKERKLKVEKKHSEV